MDEAARWVRMNHLFQKRIDMPWTIKKLRMRRNAGLRTF
jgi:hypothetical protein